jgi:hypothetical protein
MTMIFRVLKSSQKTTEEVLEEYTKFVNHSGPNFLDSGPYSNLSEAFSATRGESGNLYLEFPNGQSVDLFHKLHNDIPLEHVIDPGKSEQIIALNKRKLNKLRRLAGGLVSAITFPFKVLYGVFKVLHEFFDIITFLLRRGKGMEENELQEYYNNNENKDIPVDEKKELDVVIPIMGSTAEIARQGVQVQPTSNQESKFDKEEATHEDELYQSVVKYSGSSLEEVKEIDKELDAIMKRGLDGYTIYELLKLLEDPNKDDACLKLLLEKHATEVPVVAWVDIMERMHVSDAKTIFKNKEVSQILLDSGWLKTIAAVSPEHAKLILKKFKGRLGEQNDLIVAFASLNDAEITEAAKPTRRP